MYLLKSAMFVLLSFSSLVILSTDALSQIQLSRPKTEQPLDNPYLLNVSREQVLTAVREVLGTCKIEIESTGGRPDDTKITTIPIVFTKGVTTRTNLKYLATMPADEVNSWAAGRYFLVIEILPVDVNKTQLSITGHIFGRSAGYTGKETWIEGQSNGRLEDETLRGLAGKILGIDLSVKKPGQMPTRRIMNCDY